MKNIDVDIRAVIEKMQRNCREMTPEEIAAREAEDRETERRELEDRLRFARVPKLFWNMTFEEIERRGVPTSIQAQMARVRSYADEVRVNIRAGKGLLLSGTPGTLKTTVATATLRVAIDKGLSSLFVSVPGLIDMTSTLLKTDRTQYAEFEKRLRTVSLLLLDDFGAEGSEKWIGSRIDGLITDRWHEKKATIITTNLTAEELKKLYSERVLDRIRSSCHQLTFLGPSQRPNVNDW